MTPTRIGTLAGVAMVLAVLGYGLTELAYFTLPPLPVFAPISLAALAAAELGAARVVRSFVRGTYRGSRVDVLQVARAVLLAKASSLGGAALLGLYGGIFGWTFARRDSLATAGPDSLVAGLTVLAALLLTVAALVLERACRTPRVDP